MATTKHAVYANCRDLAGECATFRIGQATTWNAAQDRWLRLDDGRRANRCQVVTANRRRYLVESYEVRHVRGGLGDLACGLVVHEMDAPRSEGRCQGVDS